MEPELVRFVVLANSRKLVGRCVAGKLLDGSGRWIRPVSAREHGEVSVDERRYDDGGDPALRDVADIYVSAHVAHGYQTENWLIDDRYYWTKMKRLKWAKLGELEDKPGELWVNGHHTQHGRNDQVSLASAESLTSSLRLIRVDRLAVRVFRPGSAYGNNKPRVQGSFHHLGEQYDLWVTDPAVETYFLKRGIGQYGLPTSYLTISLGEPYQGNVYKLIAGVMVVPGGKVENVK